MFVLGNSCVRNIHVAIVENWATLEVAIVHFFHEIKRAVTQTAMLEIEIRIDWASPDHVIERTGLRFVETRVQVHRDVRVIQNCLHDWRVAVARYCLKRMIEIRIVCGEAQWQPSQDAGRQFGWVDTPLLLCVAGKKCFVQFAANKTQRLILKRNRVRNRCVGL